MRRNFSRCKSIFILRGKIITAKSSIAVIYPDDTLYVIEGLGCGTVLGVMDSYVIGKFL